MSGGDLVFDFSYTDDLSPAKRVIHDIEVVPQATILAFAEFAALLFDRLAPQHANGRRLKYAAAAPQRFQQLHRLGAVAVSDRCFFRVIRRSESDRIDLADIETTIRSISPAAKKITFELEIKRAAELWRLPPWKVAALSGEVAISDLSEVKMT